MKKGAMCYIILYAIALVSAMNMPVARASINNYDWIGTILRNGFDDFYGTYVTAYEEGTTAQLAVSVYNDLYYGAQLNVSAVIVGFDWGTNYTSGECSMNNPFGVSSYQSHVFMINFTVPSTSFASNLVTHSYIVYVEHVNSTSGNKRIVGSWTEGGTNFAVFSSDQADAYNCKTEVEAYPTYYYGIPFLTAKARELTTRSKVAQTMGSRYYTQGDFSRAKANYKDSLDFMQQALSNETDKWATVENSLVDLLKGGGNLLMFQGYAWLLFGIGFLLISIGVLVYLARKRTQQKTSPSPP